MAGEFTADVRRFADLTRKNMRYVAAEAIQDVVEAAQTPQPSVKRTGGTFIEGKIPVDTADLINSLVSGINGSGGAEGAASYSVAIAGFELGDTLTFEWTQPYALRIEQGFVGTDSEGRQFNQAGRHFVGANAARFSDFVEARVAEVRR
jgi:hypothetical protein